MSMPKVGPSFTTFTVHVYYGQPVVSDCKSALGSIERKYDKYWKYAKMIKMIYIVRMV